jgi:hypothetical protein
MPEYVGEVVAEMLAELHDLNVRDAAVRTFIITVLDEHHLPVDTTADVVSCRNRHSEFGHCFSPGC